MFVGREKELIDLKKCYQSEKFENILISGRRRIGKSTLIIESLKDFDGYKIYYQCINQDIKTNLECFSDLVFSVLDSFIKD